MTAPGEWLRRGPYVIAKSPVQGRRYFVVVLNEAWQQVWRAPVEGWTREQRDAARAWILRTQDDG